MSTADIKSGAELEETTEKKKEKKDDADGELSSLSLSLSLILTLSLASRRCVCDSLRLARARGPTDVTASGRAGLQVTNDSFCIRGFRKGVALPLPNKGRREERKSSRTK